MTRPIINRDPEILGGTPVSVGAIPVTALFDPLEAGDDLYEFLRRLSFSSKRSGFGAARAG